MLVVEVAFRHTEMVRLVPRTAGEQADEAETPNVLDLFRVSQKRGWQPGSKASTMIIRPPQQGQAFQSSSSRPFSAWSLARLETTYFAGLRKAGMPDE